MLCSVYLVALVSRGLVHSGVGRAGGQTGPLWGLAGPHVADELPPVVVGPHHQLDLRVEVAVGQADHQALLSREFYFFTEFYWIFFLSFPFYSSSSFFNLDSLLPGTCLLVFVPDKYSKVTCVDSRTHRKIWNKSLAQGVVVGPSMVMM